VEGVPARDALAALNAHIERGGEPMGFLGIERPPHGGGVAQAHVATSTVLSQVFSIRGAGRDLFAAAERLDLEGIVAKRKADPYGPEAVWYKVKNRAYTQSEGRWELFRAPATLPVVPEARTRATVRRPT
jgi:hypothetical protein